MVIQFINLDINQNAWPADWFDLVSLFNIVSSYIDR